MKSKYFVSFNGDTLSYDVIKRNELRVVRSFQDKTLADHYCKQCNESNNVSTKRLFKYHRKALKNLRIGNLPKDSYEFQVFRLEAIGRELEKKFVQLELNY
jgi:hypothetical protein